jgi:type IV secretion system protein VirB3
MRETIFKGATRPPMVMGVPLLAFIFVGGGSLLLAMWGGLLVSRWLAFAVIAAAVPTMAWMRIVSRRDDQRLRQVWIHVVLRRRNANASFWRARSYAPTCYRGSQDAFVR